MAEIITVSEAAKRLGKESFNRTYVIQLIKKGRIKANRNANFDYYEIEADEFERFIKEDFEVPKPRGRNARKIRKEGVNL